MTAPTDFSTLESNPAFIQFAKSFCSNLGLSKLLLLTNAARTHWVGLNGVLALQAREIILNEKIGTSADEKQIAKALLLLARFYQPKLRAPRLSSPNFRDDLFITPRDPCALNHPSKDDAI